MFPRPKRFPRLLFFGVGCLVAAGAFALSFWYYDLVQTFGLGGPAADTWPAPVKLAREVIGYSTWIALAGMAAARIYYGGGIRLFSFAGGLAMPYLALMACLFVLPVVQDYWHRQDFEASAWRAGTGDEWSQWPVRLTMANDLVKSGSLQDKTRAEIEALLGPPTETAKFSSWDLIYRLGPERGLLSIDSEWLVLKFGPDGRATEIALVRD